MAPRSKSQLVYDDLRQRIADGEYSPGYRLVLSRVAEQHQVSPVPVREALRRLEAEGLIRYTHNVGAEVVGVDRAEYAQVMEALAVLEGASTALAAPLATPEVLGHARELNAEMRHVREHGMEPLLFTKLNEEFHKVLCAPCPNPHLLEILGREWDRMAQVRHSTFTYVPDRSLTSVEEHENILRLIEAGAPAREIETACREHKLRTLARFLEERRRAS
ncbi:GntR family transcriptional regulator [Nigerium massiliense]|uniref:GntR family transcriptional regulator n=1 Tax=Nigerium massiliense TaxID=1522317 RepID=UPI001C491D7D|nr:GntR family transcriptional regulator [Nigerium massiliense]